jgi:hypothetical protein
MERAAGKEDRLSVETLAGPCPVEAACLIHRPYKRWRGKPVLRLMPWRKLIQSAS